MRVAVALLCLIVIIVGTTADSTKDEKSGISRVMRGVRNGNSAKKKPQEKVGGKRTRKPRRKIKSKGRKVGSKRPGNRRGGKRGGKRSNKNPGRKAAAKKSTKKRGKVSKSKSVKKTNRGNQPRTSGTSRQALKGNDCDYIDLGAITTAGTGCATNGVKFVIKGNSGVRKQFLYVDGKVIIALTKLKFAECTAFTDITSQVNCKAVAGLDVVSLVGTNTPATPGATTSSSSSGLSPTPTPTPTPTPNTANAGVLMMGGIVNGSEYSRNVQHWGNCGNYRVDDLPIGVEYARATIFNEKIFLCGGQTKSLGVNNKCHIRDKNGSTVNGPDMINERIYFSLNTVGSTIVAIGGLDKNKHYLDTFEVLKSGNNGSYSYWQAEGHIIPRCCHCAVTIDSNKVMLIGGYNSSRLKLTQLLFIDTGSFQNVSDLPEEMADMECGKVKNQIWATGGNYQVAAGGTSDTAFVYNIETDAWITAKAMEHYRRYHVFYEGTDKNTPTVYSGTSTGEGYYEMFNNSYKWNDTKLKVENLPKRIGSAYVVLECN